MVTDLLKNRCSVRRFQDRPIPDEVLQDILEAGRLSPSGGNEQFWKFGVITDRSFISQIAQIAHQQEWIAHSPLLIVLCTIPVGDERGGREIQIQRFPEYARAIEELDQNLYWALNQEEHQTKIAGTHMALAALEHGVGSCWVSRFEVKQLTNLLKIPAGIIPSEILVFGYPNRQQNQAPKKDLEAITFYNLYE
jgi:nitroreductase